MGQNKLPILDGEYMNLTSLIPKEGVWSLRVSSEKSMPYAYGNVFKKLGYNTHAFHNHVYNFYEREQTHPKMGFEYMACGSSRKQHNFRQAHFDFGIERNIGKFIGNAYAVNRQNP